MQILHEYTIIDKNENPFITKTLK